MNTRNKIILIIAGVLLLGLFFAFQENEPKKEGGNSNSGSESTTTAKQKEKLRLVSVRGADEENFVTDFAIESGIMGKNGIEIEKIIVDKNPTALLKSGNGDIFIGGLGGALSAYLSGEDLRLVYLTTNPFNFVAASRFAENDLVKIKKIGVSRLGGDNHILSIAALRNLGIDTKTVEFIALPSLQARAEMLARGEIDFALTYEIEIKKTGVDFSGFTMIESEKLFQDGYKKGIVTSAPIIAEKNEIIRSFVVAVDESMKYMTDHEDELVKMLREKYSFTQKEAVEFAEKFEKSTKNDNIPTLEDVNPLLNIIKDDLKVPVEGKTLDQFLYPDIAEKIK